MSDELWLRLTIVAVVGLVAVGVGLFARQGTGLVRRAVDLPGYGPGLVFFGSSSCASCARMRARLEAWPEVSEISYETVGESFPGAIDRVPAIALLDAAGRGWVAYGVVSEPRLRRWIDAGP